MIFVFVSASQFLIYLPCLATRLAYSVLNVKALLGAFNQEKTLGGAFSVIVKTSHGSSFKL